jgi:hypothetical protein
MYYIERMNGLTREWWDGDDWTDVDTDAMAYHDFQKNVAETVAKEIGGSVTFFE